jgi:AraC-like DNA-binding protein
MDRTLVAAVDFREGMNPVMLKTSDNHEPRLSAVNPIVFIDFLKEKGFSEREILASTNINPEHLSDANNQLTIGQYEQLVKKGIALTGNLAIGLEFGTRLNTTGSGLLGLGLLASNTFAEALHFAKRCTAVINPAVDIQLHIEGDRFHAHIEEAYPWEDTEPFMVDTAFALFTSAVNLLDSSVCEHLVYDMRYPAIPDEEAYRRYLSGKLNFGAHNNRISFPLEFCQRPMPFQNPSAVRQAEELLGQQIESLSNAFNAVLLPIQQIIAKKPGHIPSIEEVAKSFHVSSRTLNRRLKDMGTTFKDMVAEVRKKLAIEYLRNSKNSIDEIAYMLGYHDPSNFSKAFRNWTGHSPTQYREMFLSQA